MCNNVPRNSLGSLCCVLSCSVMSNSSAAPQAVAHQALLSMGFPRQEYWSGLPFPSPGDLPDPGIEPRSPATEPQGASPLIKMR